MNQPLGSLSRRELVKLSTLGMLAPNLLAETLQSSQRPAKESRLRFEISFSSETSATALDGRVYLLLSKSGDKEPRFQIGDSPETTQQIFGVDVDGLAPGAAAVIDASAQGYPLGSIEDVPPGDYFVQGFINIYETFHLANGHAIKLPPDRGEGQRWNVKPGNRYSIPQQIHVDLRAGGVVRVVLTQQIPPVAPVSDTKYLKHIRIQSQLLSRFWGIPTELGATVLLPEGWQEHPNARYPLVVLQLHFTPDLSWPVDFRTEPPTPDMKDSELTRAEYSYKFFQDWTSGRLPHMILVQPQHANPYYDDSYGVNSANLGPYGDAIVQELIPEVEMRYRGIGEGWARATYGGSTGGWEALAMQIFYPDFFNWAGVFCPDPIDFRAFVTANIYEDPNLYWIEGPWGRTPRPALRTPDDLPITTMESFNRYELALGTHMRSGSQFDIWQAVYGPVGSDGYPRPLYDQHTGVIDPEVAAYWREHYDLRDIMQRNWKTLGPKLVGKLHFTVGTRDTYYLDGAVRLMQKFLEATNDPYYAGDFEYGPHMPHGFWGDAHVYDHVPQPAGLLNVPLSLYTTHQRIMPRIEKWMEETAPEGADLTSWKY